MSEQSNKLIPDLRFPEFVKDGEWNIDALGYLIKEVVEKTKGRKYTLLSITSGLGLVSQIEKFGREIAGKSYDNYYVIRKGDFAYNKSSTKLYPEGEIAMLEKLEQGAVPNSIFTCFRFEEKKVNPTFAKYPFINNLHGNWLRKFIAVGARAHGALQVNSEDLFTVPFPYPSIAEQQKIALILSSLDELIEAHNQKLETLKSHKRGLMQNLFPQEDEKVPRLRFPEFAKDGEWEYLHGDKLFEPISNKKHNSDLHILAITQEHGAIPRELIDYTVIAMDKSIEGYKVVEIGDFIISLRSFQGGIEYSNYKGICSPAYIILRKKIKLVNIFFKYYFKTDLYIRYLNKNLEGLRDGKMVSYNQFSEILLPYPSLSEQQKIASCVSALDELIMAQTKNIEQLKLHKKGLMQGLFPKINY
jgi:type I restriction enzyme S subunit